MAYSPPTAREGIYFTKNLTEQTYNDGVSLLATFFQNSILSKGPYYPITNLDDMIAYLEGSYPTFIESLGDQLTTLDIGTMNKAMLDVAAKNQTTYPRPSDFAQGIIKEGGSVNYTAVAEAAVSDVVSEVVNFSQNFVTVLVVTAIVVVAGIAYFKFGPKVRSLAKPI